MQLTEVSDSARRIAIIAGHLATGVALLTRATLRAPRRAAASRTRGTAAEPRPTAQTPLREGEPLGIFLCKQIMAAHGGKLMFDDSRAGVKTFTLQLPRPKGPAAVTHPSRPALPPLARL